MVKISGLIMVIIAGLLTAFHICTDVRICNNSAPFMEEHFLWQGAENEVVFNGSAAARD